jgi:hypothetical protein
MLRKKRQCQEVIELKPHLIGIVVFVIFAGAGASAAIQGGPVCWKHLSTVTGDIPLPAAGSGELGQAISQVFDIDRDGINDFVIAVWHSSETLAWYRRGPSGWTKYLIENGPTIQLEPSGAFADIDGDGDLDIACGEIYTNNFDWWENPYPNFDPNTPWTRHVIRNTGDTSYHDSIFADLNGDGKLELITWNAGKHLIRATIPPNPRTAGPWTFDDIWGLGSHSIEGLAAADINLDGRPDLVVGGLWLQNMDGINFNVLNVEESQAISRCGVGQIIPGGRPEIVFCPADVSGQLKWYQWDGNTWQGHALANLDHAHSLTLADINGDGNLDIFTAEMAQWTWQVDDPNAQIMVFYGDGAGNFTQQIIMTGQGFHESRAADLNGDGKIDILGKPFLHNIPRLDVWLNSPVGDLNNDCSVDMNDLSLFVVQWLNSDCTTTLWCAGSDMNNDGHVDFLDYAMLAGHWLQTSSP